MNAQQVIHKQGWRETKERGFSTYWFEKDVNTIKILYAPRRISQRKLGELKNKLWNSYYSRILIYKSSPPNEFKVWANNQNPQEEGEIFDEKPFDEKISPLEYWDRYCKLTAKNTVDKKLEESILAVFRRLKTNQDDSISIILTCTLIRFLEDRNLTAINSRIVDALSSRKDTANLFKKYNVLYNGTLFKKNTLYKINQNTCSTLKSFLKNNLFKQTSLFRFDFKYIPIELISNIYERLLTEKLGASKKRGLGVVYTPPKLAYYLTREAFKQFDNDFPRKDFTKMNIGDLSVGSGIFLVMSFREILKRISKKSFEEKKRILKKVLNGTDIDPSAINITIFSLYIELLENERNKKLSSSNKFPILKKIKKGDALKNRERRGYDLIIGNPPWKSRDIDNFKVIKGRNFEKYIGNKELSQMFVHVGLEKLKNGGTLAMILPVSTFYNKNSFKFRNFILKNTLIKEFVDLSPIRNRLFQNNVEASILIVKKTREKVHSYIIPMRRAANEADYLYFNHLSGNTNNVDNVFLQSRDDSWQIGLRGGNLAASFMERLDRHYTRLDQNNIRIGTGYQAIKRGEGKTVSAEYSKTFSNEIYLLEKGQIIKKFTNIKKAGRSHILFDQSFYGDCVGIANSYKYNKGLMVKFFKAGKNRVISGDFNIIHSRNKELLYFIFILLNSKLGEFLISLRGPKTSLSSRERKNPKIQKADITKILIPENYQEYKPLIRLGRSLAEKNSVDQFRELIDKRIEKIFGLSFVEKKVIERWEKMSGRKKSTTKENVEEYKRGFNYMLDSFHLKKPKTWGAPIQKSGVEILSFSENSSFLIPDDKFSKELTEIITAKKEVHSEFINNDKGIIMRRVNNNYGFLTGLLDAELILTSK